MAPQLYSPTRSLNQNLLPRLDLVTSKTSHVIVATTTPKKIDSKNPIKTSCIRRAFQKEKNSQP
jgi:hypothetical protein